MRGVKSKCQGNRWRWVLVLFYRGPARKSETTQGLLMKRLPKWVLEDRKGQREPRGNRRNQLPLLDFRNKDKAWEVSELKSSGDRLCPDEPVLWEGCIDWLKLIILRRDVKTGSGKVRRNKVWELQLVATHCCRWKKSCRGYAQGNRKHPGCLEEADKSFSPSSVFHQPLTPPIGRAWRGPCPQSRTACGLKTSLFLTQPIPSGEMIGHAMPHLCSD